jgi:hypothetical protein
MVSMKKFLDNFKNPWDADGEYGKKILELPDSILNPFASSQKQEVVLSDTDEELLVQEYELLNVVHQEQIENDYCVPACMSILERVKCYLPDTVCQDKVSQYNLVINFQEKGGAFKQDRDGKYIGCDVKEFIRLSGYNCSVLNHEQASKTFDAYKNDIPKYLIRGFESGEAIRMNPYLIQIKISGVFNANHACVVRKWSYYEKNGKASRLILKIMNPLDKYSDDVTFVYFDASQKYWKRNLYVNPDFIGLVTVGMRLQGYIKKNK